MVKRMSHNRFSDYYYKSADLIAKDSLESKMFELTNEFGYNLASTKRRIIDEEKIYSKPKNIVNREFSRKKR